MPKIYILDELLVRQADRASISAAYRRDYVPSAEGRGMMLEGSWMTPPIKARSEVDSLVGWLLRGAATRPASGNTPMPARTTPTRSRRDRDFGM